MDEKFDMFSFQPNYNHNKNLHVDLDTDQTMYKELVQ
jgi:hypothetical protein